MSEVKLLPCPLCAGPADHRHWGFGEAEASGITCPNCGLVLEDQPDGEVLISVWNTRANLAERDAEVEELRAEVTDVRASAVDIEKEAREAWKQATHWRRKASRAERLAESLRDLLALPIAEEELRRLDKGIGTATRSAAWLRARAAAQENDGA